VSEFSEPAPDTATNDIGTTHTVTATVNVNGEPEEGVTVTFTVTSGPNAGQTSGPGECLPNADCTTDANGQVSWTYSDVARREGCDEIHVSATLQEQVVEDTVEKCWVRPPVSQLCRAAFHPATRDDFFYLVNTDPNGTESGSIKVFDESGNQLGKTLKVSLKRRARRLWTVDSVLAQAGVSQNLLGSVWIRVFQTAGADYSVVVHQFPVNPDMIPLDGPQIFESTCGGATSAPTLPRQCAFAVNGIGREDMVHISNTVRQGDKLIITVRTSNGTQLGNAVRVSVPGSAHLDLTLDEIYARAGIRPDELTIQETWVELREVKGDEFRVQVTQGGGTYEAIKHCDTD
jgi:hypothetical protein